MTRNRARRAVGGAHLAQVAPKERPLDPVDEEHAPLAQADGLVQVGALHAHGKTPRDQSTVREWKEASERGETHPPEVRGPEVAREGEGPEVEHGGL